MPATDVRLYTVLHKVKNTLNSYSFIDMAIFFIVVLFINRSTSLIAAMLRKAVSIIIFTLAVFIAWLLVNTFSFKSKQRHYPPVKKVEIPRTAVRNFAGLLNLPTVSYDDPPAIDTAAFNHLDSFLIENYTKIHEKLIKKTINRYSYIFKWEGADKTLSPVILTAHTDVVPAPDENADMWKAPPFAGRIVDKMIIGRGAIDDKANVAGILEAVEYLLKKGYEPQRTIYFAFGHDEEIGGNSGAADIVRELNKEGVRPAFVLDEGYAITEGLVPGILTPLAMIGIAEKGFVSFRLSIELTGGHSSMPGDETAIGVLTEAITRLKEHPFPARITEPVNLFMEYAGPEMRFAEKLVFANRGLLKRAIINAYLQSSATRPLVRTSMVPTVFHSGMKNNVIPLQAEAVINLRLLPGMSEEKAGERLRKIINDDRINIERLPFHSEPGKVAGTQTFGYETIDKSIKEVFPEVITAPNLVMSATDGRYYEEICDNVYRFVPIRINQDNINSIHGINEQIAVDDFEDAVRFYIRLIQNAGGSN